MADLNGLDEAIANGFRLVVAALLLLAGFSKLIALPDFWRLLRTLKSLPSWSTKPIGVAIPPAELTIGAWLAIGEPTLEVAAVVASCLFIVWGIGIATVLIRGTRLECGCFGRFSAGRATWWTVGRTFVLAGMAAVTAERFGQGTPRDVVGLPALLVVTASVVALVLLAEVLDALRAVPPRRSTYRPERTR